MLDNVEFDVVIIDEATQALEAVRATRGSLTQSDLVRRLVGSLFSKDENLSWRVTQCSSLRPS